MVVKDSDKSFIEQDEIDIRNEPELNWWADYLGIHKDKVREAVSKVGSSITAIYKFLQISCPMLGQSAESVRKLIRFCGFEKKFRTIGL
jgi:Protein of unknown function (DUF3606)